MSSHMETKHKLKNIACIKTFEDLLNSSTLSQVEKEILHAIYIDQKSLACIGDGLGYTEDNMKKKHKSIIKKLSKLI